MPKQYKILLYILGFFLILVIAYAIFHGFSNTPSQQSSNNTTSSSTNSNLPQYILSQDQETWVKEFVKNFVSLYNSYSYADYSNLTALGDYQTPLMQQRTITLVQNLQATTPIGFVITTVPDMSTFTYQYPSADQLLVSVQAQVTESTNAASSGGPRSPTQSNTYTVTVNLELTPFNQNWLVNNFEIKK